jgi:rRNA-processing protein EBP2
MGKDQRFGFGGKKRGSKKNTKESVDDISDFKKFRRPVAGGGSFKKKLGKGASKRLGKDMRNKMKNKNKKKK